MSRSARSGFTLVEIAVVLTVLTLVTAVAVPALRIGTALPASYADRAVRLFRATRASTLLEASTRDLILDADSDRWWLLAADGAAVDSGRFGFESGARWAAPQPRLRLRFSATGSVGGDWPLDLVRADGSAERITWSGSFVRSTDSAGLTP